ncbi:MAG: hypothetical protein ACI9R3_003303 [Verrucomicrobiales bacterium]|jgi:hypothetical protein
MIPVRRSLQKTPHNFASCPSPAVFSVSNARDANKTKRRSQPYKTIIQNRLIHSNAMKNTTNNKTDNANGILKHSLVTVASTTAGIIRRAGRAALLAAAALSLAVSGPGSTALASEFGASTSARSLLQSLRANGYSVRDQYNHGTLGHGQSTIVRTTLHKGNSYVLAAGGCEDAYDVDILIYDENGNLLDRDTDNSNLAVAEITPRWTGTFYIKIVMFDSTRDGAHWVLQTAWK